MTDPRGIRIRAAANNGTVPFDVPLISEIAPDLWQGGVAREFVLPPGFAHVIALHPVFWRTAEPVRSFLAYAMIDDEDQPLAAVNALAQWVADCRRDGRTLVHCQVGINRSALVVARSLMISDGIAAAQAIDLIRSRRSPACLCNPAFEAWLMSQPLLEV